MHSSSGKSGIRAGLSSRPFLSACSRRSESSLAMRSGVKSFQNGGGFGKVDAMDCC